MNSIKVPLIIFSLVLLGLVGGTLLLGDPKGSSETATLKGITGSLSELGISEDDINACIDSGEFDDRVKRDLSMADSLGLTGTPAVFIFDTQTNLGVLARGAYPFEPLAEVAQKFLDNELREGDVAFESEAMGIRLAVQKFDNLGIVADDHLRGNPQARIALIDYSDFDCPYCAIFHDTAINLVNQFGENMVWVYRHLPLTAIHPTAFSKSLVTECAQKLGGDDAFWAVTDSYYTKTTPQ